MNPRPSENASSHLTGMGLMLTAIILGGIMPVMDSTIVSIGLQTLIGAFHTTASTIQWVTTSYLLAMAVAVPVVGWAQSRFGGRPLWLGGIAAFTAGSILCSLSWSVGALIAFRALQGFAAGLLMPLMQTLGMQEARRQGITRLGNLMSTLSLPIAIGPILGPVLGGAVLNWASWHWLFLINVPIGIAALLVALPAFHDERPDPGERGSLDVVGFLSVSGGLATLLLGLTNIAREDGIAHPDVLIPLVIGVVLLVFFVAWPRSHDPKRTLIDITLLRVHSVASASSALFLVGAAMYAGQFLLPLYWQDLRGQSVLNAALLLVPQGVGSLLSRIVAGKITDRFGGRTIAVLGFLLTAATTLPFCLAGTDTGNLTLSAILFLRGLALGVLFIPVMTVAYLDIDGPSIPHASILTRVSQQVGASVGTAVAAVVLESSVRSHQLSAEQSFHAAFTATVVITLLGAVLSLWLPGRTAATPSS